MLFYHARKKLIIHSADNLYARKKIIFEIKIQKSLRQLGYSQNAVR